MVDTFLWYENKILGAKIYYENAQLIYYPRLMIRQMKVEPRLISRNQEFQNSHYSLVRLVLADLFQIY